MSSPLKTLTSTREARREAAMARLASAQTRLDAAYAVCQQALGEFERSKLYRAELLGRCALGHCQPQRESELPSCDALIEQTQIRFVRAQADLRQAMTEVRTCRDEVQAREKDMLKLQEWAQVVRQQARVARLAQDNLLEEEQPPKAAAHGGWR